MSQSPIEISSKEHFVGILQSTKIVVADFYADWCEPCRTIKPLFASLSTLLSRPDVISFVKINADTNDDLSKEYSISALPTFLLFRDGAVVTKVQGANLHQLMPVVRKLIAEFDALGGNAGASGEPWWGTEMAKGYRDVTDQIEARGSELLNADEEAGTVQVLFDMNQPTCLAAKGDGSSGTAKDWVQSGADDQLLLFLPFQGTVKIHSIQVRVNGSPIVAQGADRHEQLTSLPPNDQDEISRPAVVRLYINRPQNMDFGEADETEPTQTIDLRPEDWNSSGTANLSLRFVKFQKATSLIIYVQKGADGAQSVRLDRLRLIGEAGAKREAGKLQKVGSDDG